MRFNATEIHERKRDLSNPDKTHAWQHFFALFMCVLLWTKTAAKPKTVEYHALEEPAICKHTLPKPLKGSLITFSPKSAKIYDWALIECAKEQN